MAQRKKPNQARRVPAYSTDTMVVCLIVGLLLIALGALIFLAVAVGMVGDVFLALRQVSRGLTGALAVALPVIPVWGGVLTILSTQRKAPLRPFVLTCVLFMLVCTTATLLTFVSGGSSMMDYLQGRNAARGAGGSMSAFLTLAYDHGARLGWGGGLVGMLLAWPLWKGLGAVFGGVVTILLGIVTFLFLIRLDVKGIAARVKAGGEERRARSAQEQQQLRQQELLWQQEQLRRQQEQMRIQQEQMHQQEQMRIQQEQMHQQEQMRIQQEQYRQEQMRQQQAAAMQQPQQGWDHMMPGGAAMWNEHQGQQAMAAMPAPVQQGRAARPRRGQQAPQAQVGFPPTPEEQGRMASPVADTADIMPPQDEMSSTGRRKRGGLFRRDPDAEPAAVPRRRGLFDRDDAADEPAVPQPEAAPVQEPAQPRRRMTPARAATAAAEIPAVQTTMPLPADMPEAPVEAPAPVPDPPASMPADVPPAQSARPAAGSFAERLRRAQEEADAADRAAASSRRSRRDTPSGWSGDAAGGGASWRDGSETPERPARTRPARTETPMERPVARQQSAETPASRRQQPTASWADTPPWEDSPDMPDVQQPDTVVTPVTGPRVTAWDPELKLRPRRGEAPSEEPLFEEPVERPYVYPSLDLLATPQPQQGFSEEEDALRSRRLENTLQSFRVPAKVRHITHGPAISRFELELAAGIKVSKVTDLNRNIAMNMEVKSVRIEAPIPGKSLVGVEVPNRTRSTVTLREVLESDVMRASTRPLVVALGKDIAGTPIVCDLAKMPHLLIAGATGSGKSVCINTIINSLIYRCSPKDVRLILIDPKVVELQCYNGIPHLLIPVVSDPHKASGALAWAVGEMMDRYKRFQEAGVRAIDGYNENLPEGEEHMPRIVVVIDELADLMMTCKKDVEERICRIAQLARAAGIHLIVATQRPSVDVITGIIKANIPSRIAFKVSSNVDSRTILDRIGAEQLLGLGDMHYLPMGEFTPTRVQGCFLSDQEVNRITEFVRSSCPGSYDPRVMEELDKLQSESDAMPMPDMSGASDEAGVSDGNLLAQCIEMAVTDGQVSTSLIQRRLKLGYARAGRLVDEMEKRGIITPKDGAKPRMCLITREEFEHMRDTGALE